MLEDFTALPGSGYYKIVLTQLPQLPIKILIFESKANKVYTTLFSKSFQQEASSSAAPIQDDAAGSPDVQLVDRYSVGVSLCLIL